VLTALLRRSDALARAASAAAPWLLPTLARLLFAGVLLVHYWSSAATKLDGLLTPSVGAYAQILPRATEAAGFDVSRLTAAHRAVVLFGTWAEVILPALLIAGLLTRLAALGMIGFVLVQSWVDVRGHGLGAADVGAWFDADPSAILLDQRALWLFLLAVLAVTGGGPVSADRMLARFRSSPEKPLNFSPVTPSFGARTQTFTTASFPKAPDDLEDLAAPLRHVAPGETEEGDAGPCRQAP
jgi:putative oxidoreductase